MLLRCPRFFSESVGHVSFLVVILCLVDVTSGSIDITTIQMRLGYDDAHQSLQQFLRILLLTGSRRWQITAAPPSGLELRMFLRDPVEYFPGVDRVDRRRRVGGGEGGGGYVVIGVGVS